MSIFRGNIKTGGFFNFFLLGADTTRISKNVYFYIFKFFLFGAVMARTSQKSFIANVPGHCIFIYSKYTGALSLYVVNVRVYT